MSTPFFARVLFDYPAVEATELSVFAGQEIIIDEVNESGWCLARFQEQTGWIPTDYIEKIEKSDEAAAVEAPVAVPVQEIHQDGGGELVLEAEPEIEAVHIQPAVVPAVADPLPSPPPAAVVLPLPPAPTPVAVPAPAVVAAPAPTPAPMPTPVAAPAAAAAPRTAPVVPSSDKVCCFCHDYIRGAFVIAKDQVFHPQHFQCSVCSTELGGKAYLEKDGKFYCENDFYNSFNPKCGSCQEIIKGPYISALEQTWHSACFTCTECRKPFPGNQFRKYNQKPYCEEHFTALFAPKCKKCSLPITGQIFEALEGKYHLNCFTCGYGDHIIGEGVLFHIHEDRFYCPEHFEELFLSRCAGCGELIKGEYMKIFEDCYHSNCFKCSHCGDILKAEACGQEGDRFFCRGCIDAGTLDARLPAPKKFAKNGPPAAATSSPAPSQNRNANAAASTSSPPSAAKSPAIARQPTFERASSLNQTPSSPRVFDLSTLDPDSILAQKLAAMPKYEDPASCQTFPVDVLRVRNNAQKPPAVDPAKREQYLSDADFQAIFNMTKAAFGAMSQWKRDNAKKAQDLF